MCVFGRVGCRRFSPVVAAVVAAVVGAVVVVVVVVEVGQRPSPGEQPGTSSASGQGLPSAVGTRSTVMVRSGPRSHPAVHADSVYAQSFTLVVVVAVVSSPWWSRTSWSGTGPPPASSPGRRPARDTPPRPPQAPA